MTAASNYENYGSFVPEQRGEVIDALRGEEFPLSLKTSSARPTPRPRKLFLSPDKEFCPKVPFLDGKVLSPLDPIKPNQFPIPRVPSSPPICGIRPYVPSSPPILPSDPAIDDVISRVKMERRGAFTSRPEIEIRRLTKYVESLGREIKYQRSLLERILFYRFNFGKGDIIDVEGATLVGNDEGTAPPAHPF